MAKPLALICSCFALAFVAVACGDDDEESGGGGGGGAQTRTEEKAGGGGGAKVVEVSMEQIQFQPASVTVSSGGTVRWTNNETVPHDVTKTSGPGPNFKSGESGGMAEGDTFAHAFEAPGKVEYVCTVHSNMKGTVTVE
ncbi:MAG TPA: plastocyanin/azurin family copper-binding protein [Thermoleophilaceae bacterium]|nr:plastocyanin/azurin family copper-binding protein [Thermoleophilaceae bacterium]